LITIFTTVIKHSWLTSPKFSAKFISYRLKNYSSSNAYV